MSFFGIFAIIGRFRLHFPRAGDQDVRSGDAPGFTRDEEPDGCGDIRERPQLLPRNDRFSRPDSSLEQTRRNHVDRHPRPPAFRRGRARQEKKAGLGDGVRKRRRKGGQLFDPPGAQVDDPAETPGPLPGSAAVRQK